MGSEMCIRDRFNGLGRERAYVKQVNIATARNAKNRRALAALILVDLFEEEGQKMPLVKQTEYSGQETG